MLSGIKIGSRLLMQDVISLQCTFSTAVHMSKGEKGITQKAQLLIRQISERSLKHPRPLTVVDRIRVLLAHQMSRTSSEKVDPAVALGPSTHL